MDKAENARRDRFAKLIGKTITFIDATCINVITVTFSDGTKFTINSDDSHFGIPVIDVSPWDGKRY